MSKCPQVRWVAWAGPVPSAATLERGLAVGRSKVRRHSVIELRRDLGPSQGLTPTLLCTALGQRGASHLSTRTQRVGLCG